MKILYIADGHSPIAMGWLEHFTQAGHEVHLASTFACRSMPGLASLVIIPIGWSGISDQAGTGSKVNARFLRQVVPVAMRTRIQEWVAPASFPKAVDALCEIIARIRPDIIHALRIPYEGMIASLALQRFTTKYANQRKIPLMVSVWGNDFTLHARSTPFMSYYTRQTLYATDGLHTDCSRDQRLSTQWGFVASKEKIILPAGGGIRLDIFYPGKELHDKPDPGLRNREQSLTIINPRGIRAYVRNDTFFRAIPTVLNRYPEVKFICPGMAGESEAENWLDKLGIREWVDLLPIQSREQIADLFRQARITVSITTHDGTPNSMLEAMACGCFPIVGDIESLREWITPEVNGLLVNPKDSDALASAIIQAISKPEMLAEARNRNLQLVKERFEFKKVMETVEEFYKLLITSNK